MSSSKMTKELQAASINSKLEQMGQNIAKAIEDLLNPQVKPQSTQSASHDIMLEDSFPLPVFAPPASKGIETLMSQGSTMPIHREYFGKATAHFDDTLAFLGLDNSLVKFEQFDFSTGFIERKEETKGFEILSEKEFGNGESLGYGFYLHFENFLPEFEVLNQKAPVYAQPIEYVLNLANPILPIDHHSADIDANSNPAEVEDGVIGLFDGLFDDIDSASGDLDIQEENEVIDLAFDPLLHARANPDANIAPQVNGQVDAGHHPRFEDAMNIFGGGKRGGFKANKTVAQDQQPDHVVLEDEVIDLVLDPRLSAPKSTPIQLVEQLTIITEEESTFDALFVNLPESTETDTVTDLTFDSTVGVPSSTLQHINLIEQLEDPTFTFDELYLDQDLVQTHTVTDLAFDPTVGTPSSTLQHIDLVQELTMGTVEESEKIISHTPTHVDSAHSSADSDFSSSEFNLDEEELLANNDDLKKPGLFDDLFDGLPGRTSTSQEEDLFAGITRAPVPTLDDLFSSTDAQLTPEQMDALFGTSSHDESPRAQINPRDTQQLLNDAFEEFGSISTSNTNSRASSQGLFNALLGDAKDALLSLFDFNTSRIPTIVTEEEIVRTVSTESDLSDKEQSTGITSVKPLSHNTAESTELFTDLILKPTTPSDSSEQQGNGTFDRPELRHVDPIDSVVVDTQPDLSFDSFFDAQDSASTSSDIDLDESIELSRVKLKPVTVVDSSENQSDNGSFTRPELRHVENSDSVVVDTQPGLSFDGLFDAKDSTSTSSDIEFDDSSELSRVKLKPVTVVDSSENQSDNGSFTRPELRHVDSTDSVVSLFDSADREEIAKGFDALLNSRVETDALVHGTSSQSSDIDETIVETPSTTLVSSVINSDVIESTLQSTESIAPAKILNQDRIESTILSTDREDETEISLPSSTQSKKRAPTLLPDSDTDDSSELSRVQLKPVSVSNSSNEQLDSGTFTRPELRHVEINDSVGVDTQPGFSFDGLFDAQDSASTSSDIDETIVETPSTTLLSPGLSSDVIESSLQSTGSKAPVRILGSDTVESSELSRVKLKSVTVVDSSDNQSDGGTFVMPKLSPVTHLGSTQQQSDSTFTRPGLRHVDSSDSVDGIIRFEEDELLELASGFANLFESLPKQTKIDSLSSPSNFDSLYDAIERMNAEKVDSSTPTVLLSPIEEDVPLLTSVMLSRRDLHEHEQSYMKALRSGEKESYQSSVTALHQNLMQFNDVKSQMTIYLKLQQSGLDQQSTAYKNIAELIKLWEKIDASAVLDELNTSITNVNLDGTNGKYLALQQAMDEAMSQTNAYIEKTMLEGAGNKVQFSAENNPLISLQALFEKVSTIIESGIEQAENYKILIGEKLRIIGQINMDDIAKKIFGSTISTEDVLSSKPKSSALESAENQFQIKSNAFVEKQAQQSKAEVKLQKAYGEYLEQVQLVADKLETALPYKKPDSWGDWFKVILAQPATLAHSLLSKGTLDAHQQEVQLLKDSMQKAQVQFDYAKQDFNTQITAIAKEFHVQDNSKTVINWLSMKAEHPDSLEQQQKCLGYLKDLDQKAEIANLWKEVADQADIALKGIDSYLSHIETLKVANSELVNAYGEYKAAENHLADVKEQEAREADLQEQLDRLSTHRDNTISESIDHKKAFSVESPEHTTPGEGESNTFTFDSLFDGLATPPTTNVNFDDLFNGSLDGSLQ